MPVGTVKWFNATKGYGFIQPQGGGPDVFVHISAVERAGLSTSNENQKVEYELVTGRNGREPEDQVKNAGGVRAQRQALHRAEQGSQKAGAEAA